VDVMRIANDLKADLVAVSAGIGSSGEVEGKPEKFNSWLAEFHTRFDALKKLHPEIKWADVEKSLKVNPEALAKLLALDEKGHAMNVFGTEYGEFVFASAWDDFEKVASDHRNIAYDLEGQKESEKKGNKPNGNAVDIATAMGVDLADKSLTEQLIAAIKVNGWAWVKTDAATRKAGEAFDSGENGIELNDPYNHSRDGSFRASLKINKN